MRRLSPVERLYVECEEIGRAMLQVTRTSASERSATLNGVTSTRGAGPEVTARRPSRFRT